VKEKLTTDFTKNLTFSLCVELANVLRTQDKNVATLDIIKALRTSYWSEMRLFSFQVSAIIPIHVSYEPVQFVGGGEVCDDNESM
jgi:hypothetical protein